MGQGEQASQEIKTSLWDLPQTSEIWHDTTELIIVVIVNIFAVVVVVV